MLAFLLLISTLANPSFNEFSERQPLAAQAIAEEGSHSELQLFQQLKSRDDRKEGPAKELVRGVESTTAVPGGIAQQIRSSFCTSPYTVSLLYTQTTASDL
ncbi:MAG: hypothetical protein FJ215_05915 [Ignavibacteria bacterium]|nr:hypothetical protein [Ignavibacteria bacterium]